MVVGVVDWRVKQYLIRLEFLQKSMDEEELARKLISMLSVMLGIRSNMVFSVVRDWASVNTAAMGIVSVVYPAALNIGCMLHELDSVGDKFKCPYLTPFFTPWISLFAHSLGVKAFSEDRT